MKPALVAALRRGRRAAERLMANICKVERPTGEVVTDPETWKDVPELLPVQVRGICKVQSSTPQARQEADGGEVALMIERMQIHLPIGDPVQTGDLVTILSSPLDPPLVGLVFRLTELDRGTYRTAQRWDAELML